MIEMRDRTRLELVAAYLGTAPDELVRALRAGISLDALADRCGRPRVGVEELFAQTLGLP